jgi:hypothetical protein
MATKENTRKLKIQEKYVDLMYRTKKVPQLILSGLWLEEFGFIKGEMVEVALSEGMMIIKPLSA